MSLPIPGDNAIPVNGEIVRNPLTGAPSRRGMGSLYQPAYCDSVVKMFAQMLEASGIKLEESIIEEDRIKSKREDRGKKGKLEAEIAAANAKESKMPPLPPIGRMQQVEKRTVRRKQWRLVCAELPSLAKFARSIGVSTITVGRWRREYASFGDACQMAIDMACDALLQRGLRDQYDPEMVKFVGKNWYGLTDRHEIANVDANAGEPPQELRRLTMAELDAIESEMKALRQRMLGAPAQRPQEEVANG